MTSSEVQTKVEEEFARDGYEHGPFLQVKQLGTGEPEICVIEIAHAGEVGRSATCEPESIELIYDATNNVVMTRQEFWHKRNAIS
jgi:hypothetical protein